MRKKIDKQDRRVIDKVNRRRARRIPYDQIALELGFESVNQLYSWLRVRAVEIEGRGWVPVEQLTRTTR